MYLRALNDEELTKIKTAKQAANKVLKSRRKEITEEMKRLQKTSYCPSYALKNLERQRNGVRLIAGKPVVLNINGNYIILDYQLLTQFCKKLNPRYWKILLQITKKRNQTILVLEYFKGEGITGIAEFYELPAYQAELLQDLPVIDLEKV